MQKATIARALMMCAVAVGGESLDASGCNVPVIRNAGSSDQGVAEEGAVDACYEANCDDLCRTYNNSGGFCQGLVLGYGPYDCEVVGGSWVETIYWATAFGTCECYAC